MEKKHVPGQLELFSGSVDSPDTAKTRNTPWQNSIHFNIEQMIMTLVIVLMFVIFSFSLGVEKGKRLSSLSENTKIEISEAKQSTKAVVKEPRQEIIKQEETLPKKETKIPEIKMQPQEIDKYTIQVASFKKRSSVDVEAKSLEKKGYEVIVLPKGNYIILCVGKFSKKEEATSSLGELRKKYKDCLIREL